MWSYLGSKGRIIDYYPEPIYNTIIEPFAGTARYALKYFDRNIWINDKSQVITGIWRYIKGASKKDIQQLPELKKAGQSLKNYKYLSDVERHLLGFAVQLGKTRPGSKMSSWAAKHNSICRLKQNVLQNLHKVRHWQITNLNYDELPNRKVTWFVDAPYQVGGREYPEHKINYDDLRRWIYGRRGQMIACENANGDWLYTRPLVQSNLIRQTTEHIFTRNVHG